MMMMTRRERLARLAGLVVTLLPLAPAEARAQPVVIPPDTVSTVVVTDTVAGFGAVGGVATVRHPVWRYTTLGDTGLSGRNGNTFDGGGDLYVVNDNSGT